MEVPKKKIRLFFGYLDIYLKNLKTSIHKDKCTLMFIAIISHSGQDIELFFLFYYYIRLEKTNFYQ